MNSPWHTCMHGLGLGARPMRFGDPADATALLRLSHCYVERALNRPYARWVEVLVRAALAPPATLKAQGPVWASLHGIWPALHWPVDRSMGCALAVNVLSRNGMWSEHAAWLDVLADTCLRETLDALAQVQQERERYAMAMGATTLIHALGRVGRAHELGWRDDGREPVRTLVREIAALQEPFLRGRCLGTLLAILDETVQSPDVVAMLSDALHQEMRVLDGLLACPDLGPHDGIHQGHDHILFPLSLLLSGAAGWSCALIERDALTGMGALMRLLFDSASLRSQASQWRFCSMALMRLGCLDRQQASDASVDLARRYLASDGTTKADAYLRCCYLLSTAESFDARDLLPRGLEGPLCEVPDPARTHVDELDLKYRRQTMWSAYALFASGSSSPSLGLAQTCERLAQAWAKVDEPWDEAGCMELGHALVDVALDLSRHVETKQEGHVL